MNATQIIEFLQAARSEKGLSRYELAKVANVPLPTLVKIEQTGGAQLRSIVTIADALGLEIALKPKRVSKTN